MTLSRISAVPLFLFLEFALFSLLAQALPPAQPTAHSWFVDCSSSTSGDGSAIHPWNTLAGAQAHAFGAGDRIALKRGTVCHGSFAPQGNGSAANPIRLTAYGEGQRPRIVATANDRQALLLFNQQYWQIDSLDISGGNTYGMFVTGDKGTLHHIYLKNLYVHDVVGGGLKNKDNGLVVVGPSSINVFFDDVLVDGVIAAHTNQWAGILIGGGNFPYAADAPLNTHVTIRNSSVQGVFGDGIVLFRDSDGLIETSTAWQTGMQPTQDVGTPNAIWTWTCTDCVVRDNEAFLTDSPGVDGGAYDIDWDNTRNTVERNYAHDTQGYCFAVFGAGYVTSQSIVRNNLCINNGMSPRLAALQGAVYLSTWNGGTIDGLLIQNNRIIWTPPVPTAAAIVDVAAVRASPIDFASNQIESSSPLMYRTDAQFAPRANTYSYYGSGLPRFTLDEQHEVPLKALQSVGIERGSQLKPLQTASHTKRFLRLKAHIDFALDEDGLLTPAARAQLMVLRSLAMQYGPATLDMTVFPSVANASTANPTAVANALADLNADPIRIDHDNEPRSELRLGEIQLLTADGHVLRDWRGFQNASVLGGAVRAILGAPQYPFIEPVSVAKGKK